jgi:para-aminobenzoate synthetase component 1
MIDFELTRFHIIKIEDAAKEQVFYQVGERSNAAELLGQQGASPVNERSNAAEAAGQQRFSGFRFDISPVSFDRYEKAFSLVRENILHGNSFLLNLTFPTQIDTDLNLQQIFQHSMAPYKLLFKNRFVLFSPETFIRIRDGYIFSYPMKGTIDAAIPQAEQVIMHNEKEMWEHNTIVDLIRNDLSMVAQDVEVTKYRYIDRVSTHKNELLQVSSEIRGRLERDWKESLGETILQLLPAGSISGAPKKKTLEIIATAEGAKRGYFTGIFGIFDGATLDSGVMIRYLERTHRGLQFRSGGGITGNSEVRSEYDEMIAKVYVPFI